MADQLGITPEQPHVKAPPAEDSYVEAERNALQEEVEREKKDDFLEDKEDVLPAPLPLTSAKRRAQSAPLPVPKDEAVIEVEKILEKDLADVYQNLPENARPIFRKKGEEAAVALAEMIRSLDLKVKKALHLIRDWLLTIPRVNKFFLEQQAKIKVDELKNLVDEKREERSRLP